MYVFCRFNPLALGKVTSTSGVIKIVGFGGKPAEVAIEEIEALQLLGQGKFLREPWRYLPGGTMVRLASQTGQALNLHPAGVSIENCHRVPASQSAAALHRRQVSARSAVPYQGLSRHYGHDHRHIRISRIRKRESPAASFACGRSYCKSDLCTWDSLFQTSGRRFQPCFSLLRRIAPRPRQECFLRDGDSSPSLECSNPRRRSGQSD